MFDALKQTFLTEFGRKPTHLFSAPGRTELSGNHTDHQLGRVLAAAVDLDTVAAVAANGDGVIRVCSEGYPRCEIRLDALTPMESEKNTTAALIRGVAAAFAQRGVAVTGFDACVTSRVLPGSGLSSSAAFEVLMGTILNHICKAGLSAVEIAQIGQYAENVFFGKPCGLMDQMASSVGGVVAIDFADPKNPVVEPLTLDMSGYALCLIDTGADHADLTDEYAAIPGELRSICEVMGCTHLRQLQEEAFVIALPELREACGDRAVLRALHVFDENRRVEQQTALLKAGNFEGFLKLVKESGNSSWKYLQNIVPAGQTRNQPMALALALAEELLEGEGACRVHGGGFAGTVQAFVPQHRLAQFKGFMEAVFGEDRCHVMSIRAEGGRLLEELS